MSKSSRVWFRYAACGRYSTIGGCAAATQPPERPTLGHRVGDVVAVSRCSHTRRRTSSHFPETCLTGHAEKSGRIGPERGQCSMTFSIGETVVYPNHGTAVIEDIENRTIKGEDRMYLVLRIIGQNDLVVRVPACNLDLVGVRDVVDEEGLEKVFNVLRDQHTEEPSNWSRRFKANMEKLHSGNILKVAEVVRDLWRRDQDKGLSAGEKRMLTKARTILVEEVAIANKLDNEKAEERLDEILAS